MALPNNAGLEGYPHIPMAPRDYLSNQESLILSREVPVNFRNIKRKCKIWRIDETQEIEIFLHKEM